MPQSTRETHASFFPPQQAFSEPRITAEIQITRLSILPEACPSHRPLDRHLWPSTPHCWDAGCFVLRSLTQVSSTTCLPVFPDPALSRKSLEDLSSACPLKFPRGSTLPGCPYSETSREFRGLCVSHSGASWADSPFHDFFRLFQDPPHPRFGPQISQSHDLQRPCSVPSGQSGSAGVTQPRNVLTSSLCAAHLPALLEHSLAHLQRMFSLSLHRWLVPTPTLPLAPKAALQGLSGLDVSHQYPTHSPQCPGHPSVLHLSATSESSPAQLQPPSRHSHSDMAASPAFQEANPPF